MNEATPDDLAYRDFVGPVEHYDVMGATQFALLYALGIRQDDRLLDVGCGSLRAGRLFIAYLEPGNYVGIEPNTWLIDDAIRSQIGQQLVDIKRPLFRATESFDTDGLGTFDFVLAQSIASHAGPELIRLMLRSVRSALAPQGLAAVTFIHGNLDHHPVVQVEPGATGLPEWLYPDCFGYRPEMVADLVSEAGLVGSPIRWFHPDQTWWLLTLSEAARPPADFLETLGGLTLAKF